MQGQQEEPAPPGYHWVNVKHFDENGKPFFTRELKKMMMCGGFTDVREADASIKEIANNVKDQVEKERNAKYSTFEAVKFASQVVAGINYKIKVKVGDNEYLHINVFRALPCYGGQLSASVTPGTFKLNDPL